MKRKDLIGLNNNLHTYRGAINELMRDFPNTDPRLKECLRVLVSMLQSDSDWINASLWPEDVKGETA